MPDRTIATYEAALAEAADAQAALALSKLRLFDSTLVPDVSTTKVDMAAAETLLTGYPAGGYTLTAFTDPQLAPGGGAVITSPAVPVNYASGDAAAIGGGWVETAGGDVWRVFIFDPPITLAVVGDGFIFIRQLLFGRNA